MFFFFGEEEAERYLIQYKTFPIFDMCYEKLDVDKFKDYEAWFIHSIDIQGEKIHVLCIISGN